MRVVAIDASVAYASIAAIAEDGRPRCAYRVTPEMEGEGAKNRSVADDHLLHIAFAEDIVETVTRAELPALVVLRRPSLGIGAGGRRTGKAAVKGRRVTRFQDYPTEKAAQAKADGDKTRFKAGEGERIVTLDHSAIRRLAVHWELVRQLTALGVPIAEIGVFSAEEALNGGYTKERRVGARQGVQGYGALAKLTQALYSEATLGVTDERRRNDARYRVSTVALAALGALVVEGIPSPIPATEPVWETLRRGATFPREFPLPRPGDLEAGTTHGQRVATFYEAQEAKYDEMDLAELEEMEPRRNRNLAAAREAALAEKRAKAEERDEAETVDPMLAAERDAEL